MRKLQREERTRSPEPASRRSLRVSRTCWRTHPVADALVNQVDHEWLGRLRGYDAGGGGMISPEHSLGNVRAQGDVGHADQVHTHRHAGGLKRAVFANPGRIGVANRSVNGNK